LLGLIRCQLWLPLLGLIRCQLWLALLRLIRCQLWLALLGLIRCQLWLILLGLIVRLIMRSFGLIRCLDCDWFPNKINSIHQAHVVCPSIYGFWLPHWYLQTLFTFKQQKRKQYRLNN
jgi:hypothetical protein